MRRQSSGRGHCQLVEETAGKAVLPKYVGCSNSLESPFCPNICAVIDQRKKAGTHTWIPYGQKLERRALV